MTYLSEFSAYLKGRSDSPYTFHHHAGLFTLSMALGNAVTVDGWMRPIYPNLWQVILAPSGMGKSVPLDFAEMLMERAGLADSLLPTSFSQEQMLTLLAKKKNGAFLLQEFSAFQQLLLREYNAGSQQTLTDLYDVPNRYERSLRQETIVLDRPFLSILGASSPAWFAANFQSAALSGGFLARFLFVPSSEPGKYVDHPGPHDEATIIGLAGHLHQVRQLFGKANLGPSTWKVYNDWARESREAMRKEQTEEFSGMRSRASALVLKIALLFSVSRDGSTLNVSDVDVSNAIKFVSSVQLKAENYLRDEVARDKDDASRMRILEMVRAAEGQMAWSTALRNSHMDAGRFKAAVGTLCEGRRMMIESTTDGKRLVVLEPEEITP